MYDSHMPELTRLTVNLTAKSVGCLEESATAEDLSRTDIVNRALQTYAFFMKEQREGSVIYLRRPDDPDLERVRLL